MVFELLTAWGKIFVKWDYYSGVLGTTPLNWYPLIFVVDYVETIALGTTLSKKFISWVICTSIIYGHIGFLIQFPCRICIVYVMNCMMNSMMSSHGRSVDNLGVPHLHMDRNWGANPIRGLANWWGGYWLQATHTGSQQRLQALSLTDNLICKNCKLLTHKPLGTW